MTRNEETHVRAMIADTRRPVCVNADSARAWLSLAMGEVDTQRRINLLLAEQLRVCSELLSMCAGKGKFMVDEKDKPTYDFVQEFVAKVSEKRHEILEKFAEAYLAEVGAKPSEIEMVESNRGTEVVWFFRKRGEQHPPLLVAGEDIDRHVHDRTRRQGLQRQVKGVR